jgi:hypothetical protein
LVEHSLAKALALSELGRDRDVIEVVRQGLAVKPDDELLLSLEGSPEVFQGITGQVAAWLFLPAARCTTPDGRRGFV